MLRPGRSLHRYIPSPNPNDEVYMYAKDLNTGAYFSYDYSAYGATTFIGVSGPSGNYGDFTGPMTEQYFSDTPFYGPQVPEKYIPNDAATSSAKGWLAMDEFCSSAPSGTPCDTVYTAESGSPPAISPTDGFTLVDNTVGEQ